MQGGPPTQRLYVLIGVPGAVAPPATVRPHRAGLDSELSRLGRRCGGGGQQNQQQDQQGQHGRGGQHDRHDGLGQLQLDLLFGSVIQ